MTTTLAPTLDRPTAPTTEEPELLDAGAAPPLAPAPAPAERTAVDRVAGAPERSAPAAPLTARLALSGHVSRADSTWLAPELDALVATGAAVVEIDLSAVTHLDGPAARLLLRTSWRLGDPSRRVLLLDPSPEVHRVLRWYGAAHLVPRRRGSRGRSGRRYPRAG